MKALWCTVPFIAIGLITTGSSPSIAGVPTTASVVVFNTVCTQCHEMECSRRLSFSSDSPAENARSHIRNYAGSLDAAKIEELAGLIEYTKTKCDYYAPDVPIPGNGVWSTSALAPMATPAHTGWFVPLGALPVGAWALKLNLSCDQPIDIEVLTREGVVAQERTPIGVHVVSLVLGVSAPGLPHFLRLRSQASIVFTDAVLSEARSDDRSR